jgi:hypothetical protein
MYVTLVTKKFFSSYGINLFIQSNLNLNPC